MYNVFYETRWLKKWKPCGHFYTMAAANEHINYLIQNGIKLKFFIEKVGSLNV